MMDCVGGYYGEAFKVFRDVTKGDPLYPTIFDVVVDVVVHHWVFLVVGIMGGLDGWWVGGGVTETPSSARTKAWLRPPSMGGFRGRLTPPMGFSTGWGFIPISGR